MKYRAEIDGLRAVAVLPVVLFHSGFEIFSGGYVGVDVFFVISGYLITCILTDELDTGTFSLISFYERRARRILPALFCITFACLPFAWIWLDPFAMKEFSQSLVSVFSFTSNIYFFLKTGYFDVAAGSKPLIHTWSLAVEEQFYIGFPIFLFLFWRYAKDAVLPTIILLLGLSLLTSETLLESNYAASFYMPHSRAWELLFGALASFYLRSDHKLLPVQLTNFLSITGLTLLGISIFVFDEATPFPGLHALLPVLGTTLIILFTNEGSLVYRLLTMRLLILVGLISYSLYLWHQPVLAYFRILTYSEPTTVESVLLLALITLLSYATYVLIETPFRKKRNGFFSRSLVFVFSVLVGVFFILVGVVGHSLNGFPARNEQFLRLQQNYGLSESCSGAALDSDACQTAGNPKAILWGDSHAMHLGKAMSSVFSDIGLQQTTLSACPPIPGFNEATQKAAISCVDYNTLVIDKLRNEENPADYYVIISTNQDVTSDPIRDRFVNNILELKELGYNVIIVSTTPKFRDVDKCILQSLRARSDFSECKYSVKDIRNLKYFDELDKLSRKMEVTYVNLLPLFCDEGFCSIVNDGKLLLRDASHLSVESMPLLSDFLKANIFRAQ